MDKNKNLYFAPFHGITTRVFREVFFSHFGGIDTVLTPFLPAGETFLLSEARFKDVFPLNSPRDLGVNSIVQLIGNKQKDMSDTVLYLHDKGFDRINWNIACPMPQIVRKKRGCGLMPFPDEIERAVEDICKKTNAKFSIKMRLGMYKADESLEIIRRMNNYPLDFIAIHARLGTQMYSGDTDKESFKKCFDLSKTQLCYNGDVFSTEAYLHLRKQFPALDSCMLGRGLLQNPFLGEQIRGKEIPKEESSKNVSPSSIKT